MDRLQCAGVKIFGPISTKAAMKIARSARYGQFGEGGSAERLKRFFCTKRAGYRLQRMRGDVHRLDPQRDPRTAFLRASSDFLPQPSALFAKPGYGQVIPLFITSAAGWLCFRGLRERCPIHDLCRSLDRKHRRFPASRSSPHCHHPATAVSAARAQDTAHVGGSERFIARLRL